MYSAFDSFLRVKTWHTIHPLDEERFFRALATVVRNPRFNAEALGEYIDKKQENAEFNLTTDAYDKARKHYVNAASAVARYLTVTGEGG